MIIFLYKISSIIIEKKLHYQQNLTILKVITIFALALPIFFAFYHTLVL